MPSPASHLRQCPATLKTSYRVALSEEGCVDNCYVHDVDGPKASWVSSFTAGPPDKDGVARIVDEDGGRDDAENSYYEAAADPRYVLLEQARRRFRGQYLRHLRRRANREREDRT